MSPFCLPWCHPQKAYEYASIWEGKIGGREINSKCNSAGQHQLGHEPRRQCLLALTVARPQATFFPSRIVSCATSTFRRLGDPHYLMLLKLGLNPCVRV